MAFTEPEAKVLGALSNMNQSHALTVRELCRATGLPEVSGETWHQDEARIHALAAEHGRSIILMYYGDAQRPGGAVINRLMNLTYAEYANEIIAPGANHFEPGDIPALVKIADVICADTGMRYTIPAATPMPTTRRLAAS
ncbi:hypothetical protein ACFXO9_35070 [Nocardia tengchongensis]|uniref:hypothetical protein n=1 Tax=Nocardia tengchongensis TaxID=2055889 RepID=UPI0036C5EFB3